MGIHWGRSIGLKTVALPTGTKWLEINIRGGRSSDTTITIHGGHDEDFWRQLCDLADAWRDSNLKPLPEGEAEGGEAEGGEAEAIERGAFSPSADDILRELNKDVERE